ncbi:hypothetical protein L9G16_22665, partial [Shewanella sp. A25]|nr:hypothetical protein [Shewanella shenzhenensis]
IAQVDGPAKIPGKESDSVLFRKIGREYFTRSSVDLAAPTTEMTCRVFEIPRPDLTDQFYISVPSLQIE